MTPPPPRTRATDDDVTRQVAPSRRRSEPRREYGWKSKFVVGSFGLAATVASGYYSGITAVGDRDRAMGERVAKVEARQEEQYKAVLARLDDVKTDLNGARAEILNILRERR